MENLIHIFHQLTYSSISSTDPICTWKRPVEWSRTIITSGTISLFVTSSSIGHRTVLVPSSDHSTSDVPMSPATRPGLVVTEFVVTIKATSAERIAWSEESVAATAAVYTQAVYCVSAVRRASQALSLSRPLSSIVSLFAVVTSLCDYVDRL